MGKSQVFKSGLTDEKLGKIAYLYGGQKYLTSLPYYDNMTVERKGEGEGT